MVVLHTATAESTQACLAEPWVSFVHLSVCSCTTIRPHHIRLLLPVSGWTGSDGARAIPEQDVLSLHFSVFCQVSEILGSGWNQKQSTRIFLKYSSLWLIMGTVKQLCSEVSFFYLPNALIYQNCFTENFDTALPWRRSEFKIWHLNLIKCIRNSQWINQVSHFVV